MDQAVRVGECGDSSAIDNRVLAGIALKGNRTRRSRARDGKHYRLFVDSTADVDGVSRLDSAAGTGSVRNRLPGSVDGSSGAVVAGGGDVIAVAGGGGDRHLRWI